MRYYVKIRTKAIKGEYESEKCSHINRLMKKMMCNLKKGDTITIKRK